MGPGDRRQELLDGATAWAVENGVSTLSLRPLAAALGTSDRMLVYYFGSRDGLVDAIAGHAGATIAATMGSIAPSGRSTSAKAWLDRCWSLFGDPTVRPVLALLFELDSLGVRDPARFPAAQGVAAAWKATVDDALTALGVPARTRTGLTPVVAAAAVGLALDALVTPGSPKPTSALRTLAALIDSAHD